MIAVTGANGQFGTLVIEGLLKKVPAGEIVAVVRNPAEASVLQQLGVQVRQGDYDQFETLAAAFQGVEKVLLISAVVPGQRLRQHKAVIDAAKTAGVTFVAYTSMLNADTSTHMLAAEHLATEQSRPKQCSLHHESFGSLTALRADGKDGALLSS